MDWQDTLARLRDRLPELDCQIAKFESYFPLNLLPPGLFRDVHSGADCIQEIAYDLQAISNVTSDCVLHYSSKRLSQKIHVLVHICRTYQPSSHSGHLLEKMGTRMQWLEQTEFKQKQLMQQRSALIATQETMRVRHDVEGMGAVQKEIQDLDAQILALQLIL